MNVEKTEVRYIKEFEEAMIKINRTPYSRQNPYEAVCGMLAEERTLDVDGNACPNVPELEVQKATVECGRVIHDTPRLKDPRSRGPDSQHGQDKTLFDLFFNGARKPKRSGTYLDIGSNMPRQLSNTWFYDLIQGWKGACVEANPGIAALSLRITLIYFEF